MTPEISAGAPRVLKTLSRRDPEFTSYLDGSFSQTELALPLRSLNVGLETEEVTFEILAQSARTGPSPLRVALALIRPTTLILTVGPMIATLFYVLAQGLAPRPQIVSFTFLGVLAFHIALNLFNDYGDHMKGQDRLREKGGSRAIQNGWIRARTVRSLALVLTIFAAACGVPAILLHAAPLAIVAGLALLFALELAFQKFRLKYHGWAEVLAFALSGPLLTVGFAWAVTGAALFGEAALGCIFGAIALMYFHSANFENIMTDSQAGVRTWATRAGFDSSKTFFSFTCGLTLLASALFVFIFERNARLLPVVFSQALFVLPVFLRVRALASPLSSDLSGLRLEALKLALISTVALVGGFCWVLAARAA